MFELENLGQTEERIADGGHGLFNSLSKIAASMAEIFLLNHYLS